MYNLHNVEICLTNHIFTDAAPYSPGRGPLPPSGLKEISSLASWTVSTNKPGCGVTALRSPDTNLFWQSDGPQPHLLSIHFFKCDRDCSVELCIGCSYRCINVSLHHHSRVNGPALTISSSEASFSVAKLALSVTSNTAAPSSVVAPSPSGNSNATSTLPNGGILSIPVGGSTPIPSLLAAPSDCAALLDGQLPSKRGQPPGFVFSGNVRTYYITAEQATWNYAPSGW